MKVKRTAEIKKGKIVLKFKIVLDSNEVKFYPPGILFTWFKEEDKSLIVDGEYFSKRYNISCEEWEKHARIQLPHETEETPGLGNQDSFCIPIFEDFKKTKELIKEITKEVISKIKAMEEALKKNNAKKELERWLWKEKDWNI